MIILVDAMGGDNAPDAVIKGAVRVINEIESEILLIGDENIINAKVKEFYNKENISEISDRIKIYNTTQVIDMEDIPTQAIREKKDSSMVVSFKLLKEEKVDVMISAGNSGALLTGATLLVGRIKGIDRPALSPILPAYKKSFMVTDAGANTNCKPINLLQFAQMSNIYMKNTYKIEKPVIALLNIGTEENKGNDLIKESYKLLKEKAKENDINFIGNIEGREVFEGLADVVLTDGFTGNVFLKTVEGVGKFIKNEINDNFRRNIITKIGAVVATPALKGIKKSLDYGVYGGALFLGVKKPVIKAHGSSNEMMFYYTIKQAEEFVKTKSVEKMIESFKEI